METKDHQAAFFSALSTEHFVIQTAIGATLSEAQQRASMLISVLTGILGAMGFVTHVNDGCCPSSRPSFRRYS